MLISGPGRYSVKTIALAILLPAAGLSQQAINPPVGLVAVGNISEDWKPPVYSGVAIPGLRIAGKVTPAMITALVPADLAGQQICVSVTAAQDLYTGRQTFTVAEDWVGGLTSVPLVTRYVAPPQELAAVGPEDALTRVSVGPCEAGGTNTLLVSGWKTSANIGEVLIFVNAKDSEQLSLKLPGQAAEIGCSLDVATSKFYTHRCALDTGTLGAGRHSLEILRSRTVFRKGLPETEGTGLIAVELWLDAT